MLDVRTLQVMKEAREFKRLRTHVPERAMDERTRVVLDAYDRYFKEFKGVEVVDYRTFVPWFENHYKPKMREEERAVYRSILKNALTKEPAPEIKAGLLRQLNDCKLQYDLTVILQQFENGDCPDMRYKVHAIMTESRMHMQERVMWIDPNIEGQLDEVDREDGLRWPLFELDAVCRPLRAGDFIIVAARPGKGKTSFMAFLVAHWIPMLPPDKNVVWLNNEGKGERIYMRAYQAALRENTLGLSRRRKAGTLHDDYAKVVGRADRLRVFDVHGFSTGEISAILEENNPGLIIYDMLGNISLTSDTSTRSDERVEKLAQWGREEGVKLDAVGICTWQISGEGANMLYPPESALMNSKTAAQGACDGIIMLGNIDNPAMRNIRGLSMPKTKMSRPGTTGDPHCEIQFIPDTSTYASVDLDSGDPENSVDFDEVNNASS